MKIRTLLFRCLMAFLCIISQSSISPGQPGDLDSGFNGTGQYFSLVSRFETELAWASALQPDGKLLVAGGGSYQLLSIAGLVIRR